MEGKFIKDNPRIYQTSVFVLMLVLFLVISIGISYTTLNRYLSEIEFKRQSVELTSEVKFLDEELTALTYKSVYTPNLSYFDAYQAASIRLVDVLEMLLKEDVSNHSYVEGIISSNLLLLKMEDEAFVLAKAKQSDRAIEILESSQYQSEKLAYQKHLNEYIEYLISRYDREIDLTLKSFIASIIFLLLSAIFFLYSIGRHFYQIFYVVDLEKKFHQLSIELISSEFNLSYASIKNILNQLVEILKTDLVYWIYHHDDTKTAHLSDSDINAKESHALIVHFENHPIQEPMYDHKKDYVFSKTRYVDILRLRCCSKSEQFIELGFVKVKKSAPYAGLGLEALKRFMDAFRLAILKQQSQDKLFLLATMDSLTQILNRRSFMERLNTELQRLNRFEIDLSLLMLDIDFFKRINDNYGHSIGDMVLKHFAQQT